MFSIKYSAPNYPSLVIPAEAGIHTVRASGTIDSRLRGNDDARGTDNTDKVGNETPRALAIYIHWPFCLSKCPYCDFNSHVWKEVDQDQWRDSLLTELLFYAEKTKGRMVTSVFFGGGTPSLMPPETVETLLDHIVKHWPIAESLEVTLEANPTSVEQGRLKDFRDSGINRLSLGIQSLQDSALKFLGREHSAAEAGEALKLAQQYFDRFSFDLIYARPNQTVQDWRQELTQALDYTNGHLSVYQLTIEEGTQFYTRHQRGDLNMPDNDLTADLYEVTQEILEEAGLPAYEISNHARPGQESQHNLNYWRYGDYIGIGPGAHGRLTLNGQKYATRAHRAPSIWLEKVQKNGTGAQADKRLNSRQKFEEMLMMGLRLKEGIALNQIQQETGKTFAEWVNKPTLQKLQNHLILDKTTLRTTETGRNCLNSVLSTLITES